MAGIFLSADIGTSSLKAAYINSLGQLLAYHRTAYRPDSKGTVSARAWEEAFGEALGALAVLAPGCVPGGICISGNGPTLVPITREEEALPPLYWYGEKTVRPAEKEGTSFFLPYAAWLKKNAPGEYEKVNLFLSSHEWLARRLGAEALTVLPSSSYEPFYWNDDQCRLFGLDKNKFPPFVKMGEIMGRVSAKAAARLAPFSGGRLKSGIPIIAGGPDFITALIGTGSLNPGDVCDRAGSSEGVNVCTGAPPEKSLARENLRVLPHAKEGLWNVGALIPSSGRLFDSYRTFTGQEGRDYGELLSELIPGAENAEIFKGDFLFPSVLPGAGSSESFETFVSRSGLSGDRIRLGRAVLCAIGFAVRSAAETLAARGFPVKEMRVSGGQGKNPRWNQLKADICGISLMLPEIPDGELAGNAVLAAAASERAGMEETAERMIRFREVYKPRPQTMSFWNEQSDRRRKSAAQNLPPRKE